MQLRFVVLRTASISTDFERGPVSTSSVVDSANACAKISGTTVKDLLCCAVGHALGIEFPSGASRFVEDVCCLWRPGESVYLNRVPPSVV